MEKYYFFYGTQAVEFERPAVPEIVVKEGIKADIVGKKYSLDIKVSTTKVVAKDVRYKAE